MDFHYISGGVREKGGFVFLGWIDGFEGDFTNDVYFTP